ncbi:MAG: hypothetical protein ABL912_01150 [Novosphingobium sp.]
MSGESRATISLSGLGRTLIWLALIGLVAILGQQAGFGMHTLLRLTEANGGEVSRIARRVIAYRLDRVRPTVFRFSQPVSATRILTQPILAQGSAAPGKAWSYSVRVELLDERGGIVSVHEVYSRSVLFESSGKRRGPVQYYRGSDDQVATADEVRIAADRPISAIRVVAGTVDPGVIAIDIRVGERRPLTSAAADSAFVRFNPEDRARLAAANAFPPELLTRQERSAIAVNQWRPIGPVGIDRRDYQMMVLYEEEQEDGAGGFEDDASASGEAGG